MPRPYNIKINLKRFNNSQAKRIKEIIEGNPAIASDLSLGKLPEVLLTLLSEHKIHLLPQSWDDIPAECSCPDWANPCKHLAAVYYIVANEIDKNPFLIFNMRGISTEMLMKSSGLTAAHIAENKRGQADIFIPYNRINLENLQSEIPDRESILPDLSFSPFDIESIFALLSDNPLFYSNGDFKKILLQAYRGVLKEVEAINIDEESGLSFKDTEFFIIKKAEGTSIFVSQPDSIPKEVGGKGISLKIPVLSKDRATLKKMKGMEFPPAAIFDMFLRLPLDASLDSNSPSSRFLNISTSVALAFIRSKSFIPEAVIHGDGEFSIRYSPIIHDDKSRSAFDYLKSIIPFNLCFRQDDNAVMDKEGVYDLISMIITTLFQKFASLPERNKLNKVFFSEYRYRAERFEERQTAKSVSDWLIRLSIRKKDISPVIRIEAEKRDRFSLSIDVENKKDSLVPVMPLSKIFNSDDAELRTDISRQISIASEYIPPLKDVLNSKGSKKASLSSLELADLMTGALNILNILGIRVSIPKELKKLALPRIAIKSELKDKGGVVSYLSLNEMLDFSYEIAIGDETISKEEFIKLVKSAKGIVRFKDQYLLMNPEDVKGILEKINKPIPNMSSLSVIRSAFTGDAGGFLFNPDEALKSILNEITTIKESGIPASLHAELRPYQERGFKWLYSNTVKGFGSCIADDMGLGKTIQVIALILKLKEEKRLTHPAIVVCPTTLVGNWQKECSRFAPSLNLSIYHGTERDMTLNDKDMLITTYGMLRRDLKKFMDKRWGIAVIDEAQNIKNPDTEQTKAVKSLNADGYIAMSGTPVENRLTDLFSIFDFINRGYIGEREKFKREYAIPIEKYRNNERIKKLKSATAPFLLRRLKTDKTIITDLPDKIIFDEYCYLAKEQAAIYQQVVDMVMKEIEISEGIERRGLIFKLITSLKQICNHPVHYSKKGEPLKELSGKAEKIVDLIQKILSMKEKAIVFTQYKEMGDILLDMVKKELNEDVPFFHGGLQRTRRDKMVEDFQTKDSIKLMVISLKAGGTGLNLTAAANVIHYDLWWNPAVEAQATDRTYRIGQDKNVVVHRLITMGTFEEKIDEMIKAKKELADLTVTTGEQWITELSDKELKNIFSLTK